MAPWMRASLQMGLRAPLMEPILDSCSQRPRSSFPDYPVPSCRSFVPADECTPLGRASCSSRQQSVLAAVSPPTEPRLVVAQKGCVESHLGLRCPVAVGWRWRSILYEHASLSWAAARRYGQALCIHYSTTARAI